MRENEGMKLTFVSDNPKSSHTESSTEPVQTPRSPSRSLSHSAAQHLSIPSEIAIDVRRQDHPSRDDEDILDDV